MSLAIDIPAGYKKVRWDEVKNGDIVYLLGTTFRDGEWHPYPYGPHKVADVGTRRLQNFKRLFQFMHYSEDLLVKE